MVETGKNIFKKLSNKVVVWREGGFFNTILNNKLGH